MWIGPQAIKHVIQCRTREQRRTAIKWSRGSLLHTDTCHRQIQSPVLMTLPSLHSPASLNELKTLVEKKRHLKVCEENFWGMVLIKQMLDIISCEIWNVFLQAGVCLQSTWAGYSARSGVRKVLQEWHKGALSAPYCSCLSSLHYTAAQHVTVKCFGDAAACPFDKRSTTKSQTHLHNSQAFTFNLTENITCPVQLNHLTLLAKVMYLKCLHKFQ